MEFDLRGFHRDNSINMTLKTDKFYNNDIQGYSTLNHSFSFYYSLILSQ